MRAYIHNLMTYCQIKYAEYSGMKCNNRVMNRSSTSLWSKINLLQFDFRSFAIFPIIPIFTILNNCIIAGTNRCNPPFLAILHHRSNLLKITPFLYHSELEIKYQHRILVAALTGFDHLHRRLDGNCNVQYDSITRAAGAGSFSQMIDTHQNIVTPFTMTEQHDAWTRMPTSITCKV